MTSGWVVESWGFGSEDADACMSLADARNADESVGFVESFS